MRNIAFVIWTVKIFFISEVHAADLLATIPWNSGEQEYTVEVYMMKDEVGPYRELHFVNGKDSSIQKFETQDSFLSAFTTGEAGGCLVTIWTGGVAYRYKVFLPGDGGIQQVLEFNTRTAPDLISVGVCHTFVLHDTNTRYTWNGKMFTTENMEGLRE